MKIGVQIANAIFQCEKSNQKSKNHDFFRLDRGLTKNDNGWVKCSRNDLDRFPDPFYPHPDIRIVKIGQ